MIQQISQERQLTKYTTHKIQDEGIEVSIDPLLSPDDYIAIKVDDYYNGLHLAKTTPKAIDFLVAVDCSCQDYVLYLLELKNVKTPQAYQTHAIYEKFKNTLDHFMSEEFSHIFFNDHYRYRHIFLYLVTTAYRAAMKYGSFEKYTKLMQKIGKKDTLLNDSALSQKPFRFRNKVLFIQTEVPPNPVIRKYSSPLSNHFNG